MPKEKDYDFAGWVTKNDIRCSDGVTIRHDCFSDNDRAKVPLVWEHSHNDPENVLGHVILHNQDKGVYGFGYFNDTDKAKSARELIKHGDISSMSIAANKIKKQGQNVIHGNIFEVSLVLAGANPGALIEDIVSHGATVEDEAIIYPGTLLHSADDILEHEEGGTKSMAEEGTQQSSGKTVGEVIESMTEEQQAAVYTLLESVAKGQNEEDVEQHDNYEGVDTMKHNVFDGQSENEGPEILTHSELNDILAAGQQMGSLKDAFAQFEEDNGLEHSITNIETLFPDYHNVTNAPVIYKDQNTKATEIVNKLTKSPFSRIKTHYADLTDEQARAKGYIKGKEKLEQIFPVMHRTTDPQTIYKKQKLDRDDIIDITDFDVVQFINGEMRMMLNEEIARAVLVGDGRKNNAEDKIQPTHIRPIIDDDDLYTIKKDVEGGAAGVIEAVIKAMAEYMGSGNPDLFMTPAMLAELKLLKANDGRFLFGDIPTKEAIAARLGVGSIIDTSFMPQDKMLMVNLHDYQVGSTKGGQVTTFDDFDIDYNQYKYLIETRLSGALTALKSAVCFTIKPASSEG